MADELVHQHLGGPDPLDLESLRGLVDVSPDGIMVVDSRGNVCFANPVAEQLFGRGGRLVGEPFGIPLVAADKTDIDVPRGDGEVDVFELRVVASAWKGEAAQLVTLRDVTERVRHEAQIHELNEELQLRADAANVLRHVGDGIVLLDDQGNVRYWNPAAERVLGRAADEVTGRPVGEAIAGWRQVEAAVQLEEEPFEAAPRGASVVLELGGEECWLSVTGVRFAGGTVYAFHDVTTQVRVDELKRDFVATASHELRTPLTAIYGAAHTLQRADLTLGPEMRAQLLDVITTQALRLQRLTEDILTTRKLQEEGPTVQLERFDAAELAQEVLETFGGQAPDGIEFELEDQLNGVRMVETDPDKLRQVLANLVQNAVKYSPEGGEVRITVEHRDDGFHFEVHDQGMGISRVDIDMVFDKFYRSAGHQQHGVPGTGLGLYIARELLRRLQGDMWVESQLGAGSTFFVRVPDAPRRTVDP